MTPRCKRCDGRPEMTQWGELLCPRCGVWINADGEESPPAAVPTDPARLTSYDGFQMEHEDGWIYEYVAGQMPRRVRRTTSDQEKK